MKRLDGLAAIDAIADSDWQTEFSAYDSGNVSAFLDRFGEPVAALRWDDDDASGIAFFETRYHGTGLGGQIIEELKAAVAGLHVSGDIDNEDCARFWTQHGFNVDGVQIVRE